MIKKILLFCVCVAIFSPLWSEVSVLSVTDEDKHTKTEDFYHTYEYFVSSGSAKQMKCQATRITSRWFATAAHCVKEMCRKECTIRMDLLDTPISVLAQGVHNTAHPTVFVHPGYNDQKLAKDDLALIKLDVRRAPKIYYQRAASEGGNNVAMPANAFLAWLNKNPRTKAKYNKALNPVLPPLVDFSVSRNYEIDRQLSVVSIFNGKRSVKKATKPVYYVNSLGYAYTTNFGIQKGMSGSGVMSNTGELMGIISSNAGESWYKNGKQIAQKEWFMFPVFNQSIIAFMQATMGSDFDKIDRKDAEPSFVKKTKQDFSSVAQVMKNTTVKQAKK